MHITVTSDNFEIKKQISFLNGYKPGLKEEFCVGYWCNLIKEFYTMQSPFLGSEEEGQEDCLAAARGTHLGQVLKYPQKSNTVKKTAFIRIFFKKGIVFNCG